jgi:hypothetical protein
VCPQLSSGKVLWSPSEECGGWGSDSVYSAAGHLWEFAFKDYPGVFDREMVVMGMLAIGYSAVLYLISLCWCSSYGMHVQRGTPKSCEHHGCL